MVHEPRVSLRKRQCSKSSESLTKRLRYSEPVSLLGKATGPMGNAHPDTDGKSTLAS
jgi:hypothetical protein